MNINQTIALFVGGGVVVLGRYGVLVVRRSLISLDNLMMVNTGRNV